MYLPILALLYLLIPSTYANGCHQGSDNIGCPTVLSTDVFTTAIADFCNNHFTLPSQPPSTQSINVGNSWPGLVYSLPTYEDHWGIEVEFWGMIQSTDFTQKKTVARHNLSVIPHANSSIVATSTANFRVDRTSNGDPYVLTYPLCISLLTQAYTGNGSEGGWGADCQYTGGTSFGGWGNTDFGTVFAEAICPPGISCEPYDIRPLGC